MIKPRQILVNIVSGGAGYLIPMTINLVTTPFVLSRVGEEAYGIQVIANVIVGYLVVADMGLDIPITQKIASLHSKDLFDERKKFLGATIKIYLLIGIAGALVLAGITDFLIGWLIIPASVTDEARHIFHLSSLGFVGSIIGMWGRAVFNGLQRYDIANGVAIICNVLAIALGIVLIVNGFGIVGFFLARVLGFLSSSMVYLLVASKYFSNFRLRPLLETETWNELKQQIGFGFVLRISGMVFSKMDQTLIGVWIGLSTVTIYSFPILIVTSLSGLIGSITHFIFPMVSFRNATNPNSPIGPFFIKATKYIVMLCSIAFIPFIAVGDKILSLWISKEVAMESQGVLITLTCSFYISSCFNISVNAFLVGSGHLKYVAYYNLAKGIFLLVGFLLLIKPFGMEGAAISYSISILMDLLYVERIARKILHVRLKDLAFQAFLKPMMLGFVLGWILYSSRDLIDSWITLSISVAIFSSVFVLVALLIGIIDKAERETLKSYIL